MDSVAKAYSMEEFLYFDIETIPCQDPAYLEELKAKVKAPAQYKKPESIAKWLEDNRDTAAQDAMAKTSFDGGLGHVCTIAWAVNDGPIYSRHASTLDQEYGVIGDFFCDFESPHVLVGHYISGFDIPFLTKRAICLDTGLPTRRDWPRDPKPWSDQINDTMHMWAGRDSISLDNLCGILGVPKKDGMDGSQVADAWARGEHDKIAEYCKDDVFRTREVHKRFLAARY